MKWGSMVVSVNPLLLGSYVKRKEGREKKKGRKSGPFGGMLFGEVHFKFTSILKSLCTTTSLYKSNLLEDCNS